MSSAAQINANQQNAQHSTGPSTAEGKIASARNRFVHGLSGGLFAILPHESADRFEQLHAEFVNEHQPQTVTESMLVKALTEAWWLRNRAQRYQELCLGQHQADDPTGLPLYIRYQAHHDRLFHRALADLLKFRAARDKSESQRAAAQQRQELHSLRIETARLKIEAQQIRLTKLRNASVHAVSRQKQPIEIGFVPQSPEDSTSIGNAADAAPAVGHDFGV